MRISKRTKRLVLGFFFLSLALAFLIIGSSRFAASARERQHYETERAALREPEAVVLTIEAGSRARIRAYPAQLLPWMRASVPAEVSGRVVEVFVEAGDSLTADQTIAKLDDRLASITLRGARATLEESKRLVAEATRLLANRAISQSEFEARQAELRSAEARHDEAQEVLARHTIRAPFHGVVNRRLVDVGDAVHVNQPVAEVVDLSKLRVELHVSEHDLGAFQLGAPIALEVSSAWGVSFAPTVDFVSRTADPETRLFRVEAVLDNTAALPGGLQAIARVEVDRFEGLPLVPAVAVRFSGRESMVWKLTPEGQPERVAIKVGPELDGFYPVFEGLAPGDRVMVR